MKKGFTLVELLAVIVILAVILAIAVPGISSVINNTSKSALESDAKLVLKGIEYEKLEDSSFNPSSVNESNVKSILNIDDSNYETLTVKEINGIIYVTIVGKNKWDKLTVSGTKTKTSVNDTVANFSYGANKPVLITGMTPIKWSGSAWVDTTESDTTWYNYTTTDKKWANVRTADGSMWVWIPRYIYKISTGWHSSTVGTIDIQFSKGLDDNWNKAVIGNINLDQTANASNNTWTNHPAFTFGDIELTGIWVSKFEASSSDPAATNGGGNVTNLKVKSIPNVVSWRAITVSNMFTVTKSMETDNTYGWGTTGAGIDTHMMKNTEWGAISYLSKSSYGQGTNEIWINPADNFTTGCAGDSVASVSTTGCLRSYDTTNGVKASTTGNIYGIYDISGGTYEYVAAYANNGHGNLNNGSTMISALTRYKNVYAVGTADNEANNYALTINMKGDAVYETSNNINCSCSWFGDYSIMLLTSTPWFVRGGRYNSGSIAGALNFYHNWGGAENGYGFRPVVLVGVGL